MNDTAEKFSGTETQTMKDMETQTKNKVSKFDDQDYENAIDLIIDLNGQIKILNESLSKMGDRYTELNSKTINQYDNLIKKIFVTIGIDPDKITSLDDENLLYLMETYRDFIEDGVKITEVSEKELKEIKDLKKQLSKLVPVSKVIGKHRRGAEFIMPSPWDNSKKRNTNIQKVYGTSLKRRAKQYEGKDKRRMHNKALTIDTSNLPKSRQGMRKNARAENNSRITTAAGRILAVRNLRPRNREL
jgi:hypothetical protein